MGPELRVHRRRVVAVTGAAMPPKVDGEPAAGWTAFRSKAGEVLSFGYLKAGARAYIAVSGGIDVPVVLGSRSTYALGALGGFEGAPLKAGDVLPVGPAGTARAPGGACRRGSAPRPGSRRRAAHAARPLLAPAHRGGPRDVLRGEWKVAPEADRIGYRFRGGRRSNSSTREQPFGAGSDPSNIVDACYPYRLDPGAGRHGADRAPPRRGVGRRLLHGRHGDLGRHGPDRPVRARDPHAVPRRVAGPGPAGPRGAGWASRGAPGGPGPLTDVGRRAGRPGGTARSPSTHTIGNGPGGSRPTAGEPAGNNPLGPRASPGRVCPEGGAGSTKRRRATAAAPSSGFWAPARRLPPGVPPCRRQTRGARCRMPRSARSCSQPPPPPSRPRRSWPAPPRRRRHHGPLAARRQRLVLPAERRPPVPRRAGRGHLREHGQELVDDVAVPQGPGLLRLRAELRHDQRRAGHRSGGRLRPRAGSVRRRGARCDGGQAGRPGRAQPGRHDAALLPGLPGRRKKVDALVGIAPSNHGTQGLITPPPDFVPPPEYGANPTCQACADQQAGSPFLTGLNAIGDTVTGPSYTVISTARRGRHAVHKPGWRGRPVRSRTS